MSKFVPKFRSFDDERSNEYNSAKEFNRNKKQKKDAAELRKMRQRQDEDNDYSYVNKRYSKL